MGGRGAKYDSAGYIVGQYSLQGITDSKNKIVDFYRAIDKGGGIRIDEETGKIKVTKSTMGTVGELAEELSNRMVVTDLQAQRDYRDIMSQLSNGVSIDTRDLHDIPDYRDYLRSRENRLRVRQGALSIDSAYEELATQYPQYFNSERVTSPSDRLQNINEVLGQLRNNTTPLPQNERRAAVQELKTDIIRGYLAAKQMSGRRRPA